MSELRRVIVQEMYRSSGGFCWMVHPISTRSEGPREVATSPGELIHSVLKLMGVDIPLGECVELCNREREVETREPQS